MHNCYSFSNFSILCLDDKKSIVKDTFLESLSHSTNPHVTRSSRKLSSNHSFLREADFENLTHSITPQVTRSCRRLVGIFYY